MTATEKEAPLELHPDRPALRRARRRLDIALCVFGVAVLLQLALMAMVIVGFRRIEAAILQYGWGNVPASELWLLGVASQYGVLSDYILPLVAVVAFLCAMGQGRFVAQACAVRDMRHSLGWTIGSLIIPLLNLWRPWIGFSEIRRAVLGVAASGRPVMLEPPSGATLLLAIVFVGGNGALRALGREVDRLQQPSDQASYLAFAGTGESLLQVSLLVCLLIYATMLIYLFTIRQAAAAIDRAGTGPARLPPSVRLA
jgi:hypothetical protein